MVGWSGITAGGEELGLVEVVAWRNASAVKGSVEHGGGLYTY